MSNIDELIDRLRNNNIENNCHDCALGYYVFEAADALEKLQAELEKVKVERDAAIKDLNEFLAMDELCPIQCKWCKWNGTYCDGKTPEWRGIKKED